MTHSIERIKRFKELFSHIKPDNPMPERVQAAAAMLQMSESSIRVYLMDEPPHAMSNRSLLILEKEMRRRKML